MAGITTLPEINAEIHDKWFDVDRLVHDAERAELRLAFYPGRRTGRILKVERAPVDDDLAGPIGELIVRGILGAHIKDDAEVGWYTVEGLAFDQDNSKHPVVDVEGFAGVTERRAVRPDGDGRLGEERESQSLGARKLRCLGVRRPAITGTSVRGPTSSASAMPARGCRRRRGSSDRVDGDVISVTRQCLDVDGITGEDEAARLGSGDHDCVDH